MYGRRMPARLILVSELVERCSPPSEEHRVLWLRRARQWSDADILPAAKRPFEKLARSRRMTRRNGRAGGSGKGATLLGGTPCGQRRAGPLSATLAPGRRSATSSTPC